MNKPELSTTGGHIAKHYDNFIGGKLAVTLSGKYFDDISPLTGKVICKIPRSDAQDVEAALDAAHAEGRLGSPRRARYNPTEAVRF